jgi:hypothetical protein
MPSTDKYSCKRLGRNVGKCGGNVLRRDHSLPFAGLCSLMCIDWPFVILSFSPFCLRAKRSTPIDCPSPKNLISARPQRSTYFRNDVISVRPDLARSENRFSRRRLVYCHGRVSLCGNIHSRIISPEQVPYTSWVGFSQPGDACGHDVPSFSTFHRMHSV